MDHVIDGDHADQAAGVVDDGGGNQRIFLEPQRDVFLVHVDRDQGLLALHDLADQPRPGGSQDRRQLASPHRVMVGADDEHLPEIVG